MQQAELFSEQQFDHDSITQLSEQAFVLHGFAAQQAESLFEHIEHIENQAAFRHMMTPGGHAMSAAMTNCGRYGWFTDAEGYRYTITDPASDLAWPEMPASYRALAINAAHKVGFKSFNPECCLINRYQSDSRMGLHQDKDEQDLTAPIVSISLGISAEFLFGGFKRREPTQKVLLHHGDIVVWGGEDRLRYHGIKKILQQTHPLTEIYRFNLTFRQVM